MANRERHPVAQGGMWTTPKAQYSQATHTLLKEMMQESKLTNFQQRQLNSVMKEGRTLPPDVNPTSSAKRTPVTSATKINAKNKVLNPRNYSSNIRKREDIEASGAYIREKFVPQAQTFYEKDKQRLANIMAFGQDIDPTIKKKTAPVKPKIEPEIDRFDELEKEIEERRAFLSDMEAIGQGGKYRSIIETEVSQKIREMEIIDKKRTAQLEKLMAAEDSKKATGIPNA